MVLGTNGTTTLDGMVTSLLHMVDPQLGHPYI